MSDLNEKDIAEYLEETKKEYRKRPIVISAYQTKEEKEIKTLEGTMKANIGDFIITGIKGEEYPCKPDVFYETYVLNDKSIDVDSIEDNLFEWSSLVTELSEKETLLLNLKTDYNEKEFEILTNFDFKKKYGKDNDKLRKGHIRNIYGDLLEDIEGQGSKEC